MYQTSFSPGSVDLRELQTMAEWLKNKTGKEVRVEQVIMVTTDSAEVSNMMDSLRDAVKEHKNGAGRKPKGEKKPKAARQAGAKNEPKRGPHVRSIEIFDTGERISRFELNKRLADKSIELGTTLHTPKYGTITVKQTGHGAYIVVNQEGEQV